MSFRPLPEAAGCLAVEVWALPVVIDLTVPVTSNVRLSSGVYKGEALARQSTLYDSEPLE